MALATFTVGDALLTTLEFAFLFLWIWIAVGVVFDIFRSHDLSNWAKTLWVLFIIVLPFVGVLAYLIVRGHTLHEHQEQDRARFGAFARARHTLPQAPPRSWANSPSSETGACARARSSSAPRPRCSRSGPPQRSSRESLRSFSTRPSVWQAGQ